MPINLFGDVGHCLTDWLKMKSIVKIVIAIKRNNTMATIKSYTDLEQSKKLAEMLPIESADMWWLYITAQGKYIAMMHEEPDPHYIARMESYGIKDAAIRCWSLAALLDILSLPDLIQDKTNNNELFWQCSVYDKDGHLLCETNDNNPVDTCYEMILKLNELKLL